jgi:flagellar basal body-associated protein FliL
LKKNYSDFKKKKKVDMALKIIIRMAIIIMPGQCCYVMWMIKKTVFEASYWPHRKLNEKLFE